MGEYVLTTCVCTNYISITSSLSHSKYYHDSEWVDTAITIIGSCRIADSKKGVWSTAPNPYPSPNSNPKPHPLPGAEYPT